MNDKDHYHLSPEAALREIEQAEQEKRPACLVRADLRGANLASVNLAGAMILQSNLAGANLRYANMRMAQLHEVNLEHGDFTEASLLMVRMSRIQMGESHLEKAVLYGSLLVDVDASRCQGVEINARSMKVLSSKWDEANLRGSDWTHTHLWDCTYKNTNFVDVKGVPACDNVSFQGADFTNAYTDQGTWWEHVDMRETRLVCTNTDGNFIDYRNATFQDSYYEWRLFRKCLFQGATFTNTLLKDVKFEYCQFEGTELQNCRMKNIVTYPSQSQPLFQEAALKNIRIDDESAMRLHLSENENLQLFSVYDDIE